MFELLCEKVKPTRESVDRLNADTELRNLHLRARRSLWKGYDEDRNLDKMCSELDVCSPILGRAVRASGYVFAKYGRQLVLPELPTDLWSEFRLWSAYAILSLLRLVEYELASDDVYQRPIFELLGERLTIREEMAEMMGNDVDELLSRLEQFDSLGVGVVDNLCWELDSYSPVLGGLVRGSAHQFLDLQEGRFPEVSGDAWVALWVAFVISTLAVLRLVERGLEEAGVSPYPTCARSLNTTSKEMTIAAYLGCLPSSSDLRMEALLEDNIDIEQWQANMAFLEAADQEYSLNSDWLQKLKGILKYMELGDINQAIDYMKCSYLLAAHDLNWNLVERLNQATLESLPVGLGRNLHWEFIQKLKKATPSVVRIAAPSNIGGLPPALQKGTDRNWFIAAYPDVIEDIYGPMCSISEFEEQKRQELYDIYYPRVRNLEEYVRRHLGEVLVEGDYSILQSNPTLHTRSLLLTKQFYKEVLNGKFALAKSEAENL